MCVLVMAQTKSCFHRLICGSWLVFCMFAVLPWGLMLKYVCIYNGVVCAFSAVCLYVVLWVHTQKFSLRFLLFFFFFFWNHQGNWRPFSEWGATIKQCTFLDKQAAVQWPGPWDCIECLRYVCLCKMIGSRTVQAFRPLVLDLYLSKTLDSQLLV